MSDQGIPGYQGVTSANNAHNRMLFEIDQRVGLNRTMVPVKIVKVKGGGKGPTGTVTVQPLIKQQNGVAEVNAHGNVYNLPFTRNHGGNGTIINDPKEGDIGIVIVADRDISTFKRNQGDESPPGSMRQFSLSDGIYDGALPLKGDPVQWVWFKDDGIEIHDRNGNAVLMKSDGIYCDPGGKIVFVGGKPGDTFSKIITEDGPSPFAKAKIG